MIQFTACRELASYTTAGDVTCRTPITVYGSSSSVGVGERCFREGRSNRIRKSQGSVFRVLLTIQSEQYLSHQIVDRLIPFGRCRKNLLLGLHVL